MKERPILFSGEMVRAILSGRKTQTRRVIKPQPENETCFAWFPPAGFDSASCAEGGLWTDQPKRFLQRSPYGHPGDRLWVRETWSGRHAFRNTPPSERKSFVGDGVPYLHNEVWYWADGGPEFGDWEPARPSIHMPRWASRITLDVTDIRVERLRDISANDIKAEGVTFPPEFVGMVDGCPIEHPDADKDPWYFWAELWDSINAESGFSWDANPWVWVVEFTRSEESK